MEAYWSPDQIYHRVTDIYHVPVYILIVLGKREPMKIQMELLREFYPKGMDLSQVNEKESQNKLTLMNNRPRKYLRYKTPNEVIKQL